MAEEVSSQMNSLSISETNPSSSATISLVSGDDIVFKVEPTIAKEMETVQSFIDETDGKITTIPLPNISSHDLPYVIEYCEKSIAGKITKEFEAEFVKKLNNEEVIADRIANKSVEYVRRYFGIENDFTPEEEAKLREELAWTFTGVDPDDEDEN
ncbi:unnamed protein product [Lathyrus oleraceus]